MSQPPFDLLNLFVQPPGNFLYYLLVIVASQVVLAILWSFKPVEHIRPEAEEYRLASYGILFAWVLLFLGALFALVTRQDPVAVLPPLERAVTAISFLLLAWAMMGPISQRWQRLVNILVLIGTILVVLVYTISGFEWARQAAITDFNLTPFGSVWVFLAAAIALIGAITMLLGYRVIRDAPLKFTFFMILLAGFGGTLIRMLNGGLIGNDLGLGRLALAFAIPIIPVLVYRLQLAHFETLVARTGAVAAVGTDAATLVHAEPARAPVQEPEIPAALESTPTAAEPAPAPVAVTAPPPPAPVPARLPQSETQSVLLLRAIGMILEAKEAEKIPSQIVHVALDIFKADIVAILRVQDANYADIHYAYDKVMKRNPSRLSLNLDEQPTLTNAIERRVQRALYPDRNLTELQDLYTRLDIEQMGPVYFQPLASENEFVAVLMLGLPYVGRELSVSDAELLKGYGILAAKLLSMSYRAKESGELAREIAIQAIVDGVPPEQLSEIQAMRSLQEANPALKDAREQIKGLSSQVTELKLRLDDERTRLAALLGGTQEGLTVSQQVVAISEEQERLREERDMLARRLQEAEAALSGVTAGDNAAALNNLIEQLGREKEALLRERDRLERQLDLLHTPDSQVDQSELQLMIDRMMEEHALLKHERDQITDQLETLQTQLEALGIENGAGGLAQLIAQLFEERISLRDRVESLAQERELLIAERSEVSDAIEKEHEREERLQLLESRLENLAADREAAFKQRDKMRAELEELKEKLDAVKEHRARLLAQTSGYEVELAEALEEQNRLRTQIEYLGAERSELSALRDRLESERQMLSTDRDQWIARAEGDTERLQLLGEEATASLKRMIDQLTADRAHLEQQLMELSNHASALEAQLDAVRVSSMMEIPAPVAARSSLPVQQPDLLVGMVQELRTPMTSIIGYVDLLLSESAGILGEMQRKFLQRVAANISRLDAMVEDLIHITELDTGQFRLHPAPVDMIGLIEEAITNSAVQFREKGLTISLDLEDELPPLAADRDSLTQIVGQLLTNAYLVSPPDSQIGITAARRSVRFEQNGTEQDCLYFAVQDRGGGILPEDVPRVFARKYKAANPLIAGLGDTGVGLSIAKALVEAHNGRLWIETRPGVGTTFQVAIPFVRALETEA